jgi:hypothetical protein
MGYIETLGNRDYAVPDLFENLRPPASIHVLPLAILLSLVINAGFLFSWENYHSGILVETKAARNAIEVRLQSVDVVPESSEKEIRRNSQTRPVAPVAKTAVAGNPIAQIPALSGKPPTDSPAGKTFAESKDWKQLLSAPMVDEFLRSRDFLPPPGDVSVQSQKSGFDDVFRADLRQKLREQSARRAPITSTNSMNSSTMSDAYERVAIADKCFTLKTIADGRIDQRLWYGRECKGKTSLSETMAQAIRDTMKSRSEPGE